LKSRKEGQEIRLCVVSPLYHPSLGGLGKQAQLLTERLSAEGVELFVIARRMKGVPQAVFDPAVKIYRAWSIKPYIHTYEKVKLVNILISLTFSLSCAFLLLWKRKDYDIAHFHGASLPLFINLPLLKLLGKRVVAKVAAAKVGTEAGSLHGRYFFMGTLITGCLRMVDAFIATTAEIEEGLRNDGIAESKITRITNFIDFTLFSSTSKQTKSEIKAKPGFDKTDTIITFSGRFIRRKGIDYLLEAWKDVANKFPNAKLVLLGDGPLLSDMKKMSAGLGIDSSVDFRGHVDSVADFLHITDIFVLPSLQEGMPNSLLEAMSCGLPVIASKIGGVVDVMENGKSGILFEPGDASGLASAVISLLNNSELRQKLGAEARKRVAEGFSIDGIAEKYIRLYKKLMAFKTP
jgi:glycosyltransferase involved in cell wall biosynthesis